MEAPGTARTASPAMTEWIERDPIADFEVGDVRADFDDFARRFVAQDDGQACDHAFGAEFPIDDVQVGSANAARADANQQSGFGRRRHGSVDQFGAGRGSSLCDRFDFAEPLTIFNTTASGRRQRKTAPATMRKRKSVPSGAAGRRDSACAGG